MRKGEIWFEILIPCRRPLEAAAVLRSLPAPTFVVGGPIFPDLLVREADRALLMGLRGAQSREIQLVSLSERLVEGDEIGARADTAAVHESMAPVVRSHQGKVPAPWKGAARDVYEGVVRAGSCVIPARLGTESIRRMGGEDVHRAADGVVREH